jgi:hypothetical protein
MLNDLVARPDTRWVLATFSVMGVLNLASRMNNVYEGAGVFGVAMAFVGIGGWIHGIASVARAAQEPRSRKAIATLLVVFFALGCATAMPWHFFMFGDPASGHPALYGLVQIVLAGIYLLCRLVFRQTLKVWYARHLILGYATFACLFQSVSPKVSTDTLASALGLDLTMAFTGSTFLIFVILTTDIAVALAARARQRVIARLNRG